MITPISSRKKKTRKKINTSSVNQKFFAREDHGAGTLSIVILNCWHFLQIFLLRAKSSQMLRIGSDQDVESLVPGGLTVVRAVSPRKRLITC